MKKLIYNENYLEIYFDGNEYEVINGVVSHKFSKNKIDELKEYLSMITSDDINI